MTQEPREPRPQQPWQVLIASLSSSPWKGGEPGLESSPRDAGTRRAWVGYRPSSGPRQLGHSQVQGRRAGKAGRAGTPA